MNIKTNPSNKNERADFSFKLPASRSVQPQAVINVHYILPPLLQGYCPVTNKTNNETKCSAYA